MEANGLAGIRCVLFDAVGTLIYADPPVASVYRAVGSRFGSQLTEDEIHRRFRAALAAEHRLHEPTSEAAERERWRRIVASTLPDVPEHQEAIFTELWSYFARPESWRLYADVADAWSELDRRGYMLGIASNFDQRLRSVIAGHPPLGGCQAIFISGEIGFLKPDIRFFRAVERAWSRRPDEIALIGDDEITDAQGAAAAGWRAIRLSRKPDSLGDGIIIHALTDLL